jgi:hypothetical protein
VVGQAEAAAAGLDPADDEDDEVEDLDPLSFDGDEPDDESEDEVELEPADAGSLSFVEEDEVDAPDRLSLR